MYTAKHALILGAGESGFNAAKLLRREGARVTIFDRACPPGRAEVLRTLGAYVRAATPDDRIPDDCDLVVTSPGIPPEHPWIKEAQARGLRPIPELELGWSRFRGRVAAITGTNGKSTMVKWMAESLRAAGFRAAPAGNYGPSVCRVLCDRPDLEWLVIEASSFQLEAAQRFRADIAILLNIAPNHLDRHGTMEAYIAAKARLFAQARERDVCLAPAEWRARMQETAGGRGIWHTFGPAETDDYRWQGGRVWHRGNALIDLTGSYFDNDVLGPHAAAVAGAFHAAGVSLEAAAAAARSFEPLPHRMERVAEVNGVVFINDSKATTLAALRAALAMAGRPTRLIAGGRLKEIDLSQVKEMLALHASGIYLIGEASKQMASAWSDAAPCVVCGTLEDAMKAAWRDAQPGEAILLSPGCASFDQFESFMERGERFRRIACAIAKEQKT
jgi:UDP-N-acetylmuramoylalanine--D-glutamate ligase